LSVKTLAGRDAGGIGDEAGVGGVFEGDAGVADGGGAGLVGGDGRAELALVGLDLERRDGDALLFGEGGRRR